MGSGALDKTWHLAGGGHETALTDFEYAVWRFASAFIRWQGDCMACVADMPLSGQDVATLHVIRMRERPKSLSEIARLLNRDDIANIQYSIKKLQKAGLISKANASSKKSTSYAVSEAGRRITDGYHDVRRSLLLGLTSQVSEADDALSQATRTLNVMIGLYDQASRMAATYRVSAPEE